VTATAALPLANPTLAFDGISVQYVGRPQPALQQVTFTAHPGKITAVVGPNGSGKSSLVRTLLRRAPVTAGRVLLAGGDIATLDARALAKHVAVVPQREEPGMPLSVREFVMLGRHPRRGAFGAPSDRDRALVEEALVKAGIADAIDRTTDSLSGGEWQRVRIARALAGARGIDFNPVECADHSCRASHHRPGGQRWKAAALDDLQRAVQ